MFGLLFVFWEQKNLIEISCLSILKNVRDKYRKGGHDFKIINRLCTGCKQPILQEANGGDSL